MQNQEPEKTEALKRCGTLNTYPERVIDEEFAANDFFDPHDIVQVKYEMLRRVRQQGQSVTKTSKAFGFSRTAYYEAQSAFETGGLPGLLPRRPGPRQAHKLNDEVMEFIEQTLVDKPGMQAPKLSELVLRRFGTSVHPRSIERALARRKKKHQPKEGP